MPFLENGGQRPVIDSVSPSAAIPGGDVHIHGTGFIRAARPKVAISGVEAALVVASDKFVVARVPETPSPGRLTLNNGETASEPENIAVGAQIADSLHPVASPAVDADGNIFTTFSGSRGQKTAVAVYKIDPSGVLAPFVADMMNPTGLAFNRAGVLHVSSRFDGVVYQVTASGVVSVYVEGMGVATGIAFDSHDNLYVGDRSGTIFKISPERQIYVFATVEPSISAYHLRFGTGDFLFVTGPTTSSYDTVYRITPAGEVEPYYRGLGRPQGMDLDRDGNLYVAASLNGRRGIVRIDPERNASVYLSGPNIVGLAFAPKGKMVITTTSALFGVTVGIEGQKRL
jgi:hypothetical protein